MLPGWERRALKALLVRVGTQRYKILELGGKGVACCWLLALVFGVCSVLVWGSLLSSTYPLAPLFFICTPLSSLLDPLRHNESGDPTVFFLPA